MFKQKFKGSSNGQSLLELMVAIGIFVLAVSAIMTLVFNVFISDKLGGDRMIAVFLAEEGLEAARAIRDDNWDNLTVGSHGLAFSGGNWAFQGTEDDVSNSLNQGTRAIDIEDINSNTKKITSQVNWLFSEERPQAISLVTRFVDWSSFAWRQTLKSEFDLGKKNSVQTTETDDGEVLLDWIGDWSTAFVHISYNTDGNGDLHDIYAINDIAYLALGNDGGAGNEEFLVLDFSDVANENITELGAVELGATANAVYVLDGYAYLGTNSNTEEIMIIRLSDYTKVNSINIPSNSNALSVFAIDSKLYAATTKSGSEEFYVYDISTPEGTVAELGATEIDDDVNGIWVSNGYAYLATDGDDREVSVVRLSDYSEVNTIDLPGNSDGTSIMGINNIVYLGREGSQEAEFYGFDISYPEGGILEIGSTDLENDDVNDIFIRDDEAYMVTDKVFRQEVVVVNLADFSEEASIEMIGLNTVKSVWAFGSCIYAGSSDNSNELQVITGGRGGWSNPSLIGSYNSADLANANDVFVSGNYAYLATQNNLFGSPEFYIIDISTPGTPVLIGSIDFGFDINKVYVSGNYAYLATDDDSKEFIIVDISSKSLPLEVGSYDSNGGINALSVFVSGNYAYLGTENNVAGSEFYAIDVLSPATPSLLGIYEVGGSVFDITVSGSSAYLATANNNKEFLIIDISNPTDIYERDFYNTIGDINAYGVERQDNVAYLVTNNNGIESDFYIFDVTDGGGSPVSDWSNPQLKGIYDSEDSANANDVFVSGNYAYLATQNNLFGSPEFYIIDISTPGTPVLIGSIDFGFDINKVYVSGNYAYLATDNNSKEFIMVDITNKANPIEVGSYNSDEGKNGMSVFAVGDIAYLGTQNNSGGGDREFYILDVSNPTSISLLGSREISDDVRDIHISGDYAYLATSNNSKEFIVLDISNPTSISEEDSYNTPSSADAFGVYYLNGAAYLVTNNNGSGDDFYIFNVSTPSNISLTGSANLDSDNRGVEVFGDYAYVSTRTSNSGLTIVDISTPSMPSEFGNFNTNDSVNGIYFDGTNAYLATEHNAGELQIVGPGASVPSFISLLGSVDLDSDNRAVAINSDYAFVATSAADEELTIVDISDSSQPVQSGSFDAGDNANGVVFDGTYAYLATENDDMELQIIGEGVGSYKYASEGLFSSSAFDSASVATVWKKILWTESGFGELQFQIRVASSEAGLDSAVWAGPDGTNSTYYTTSGEAIMVDPGSSGTQWIQYKAFFVGNSSTTPIFEDITIKYE